MEVLIKSNGSPRPCQIPQKEPVGERGRVSLFTICEWARVGLDMIERLCMRSLATGGLSTAKTMLSLSPPLTNDGETRTYMKSKTHKLGRLADITS